MIIQKQLIQMRMTQNSKFITSPSVNLPNPLLTTKKQGFYTYSSFYTKKSNQIESTNHQTQSLNTLIKQFSIIDMMRKKSLVDQSENHRLYQRNMNEIFNLIRRQKHSHSIKQANPKKQKRQKINEKFVNVYETINSAVQMASQTINHHHNRLINRSMSFQMAQQPTKVKMLKKMLLFNKNKHSNQTSQNQINKNMNYPQSSLRNKRKSKLSPLNRDQQIYSLDKMQKNSCYKLKSIFPQKLHIHKQQSVVCKGQILSKQGSLIKRKNRLREYNLKQIEIQPIFLQQV